MQIEQSNLHKMNNRQLKCDLFSTQYKHKLPLFTSLDLSTAFAAATPFAYN